MDTEQAKLDVMRWIQDFVERPNVLLNGWAPCPFARQARLKNQIDIRIGVDPYYDLKNTVRHGMGQLDVVVLVYDASAWSLPVFRNLWQQAEQDHLQSHDLYVLEDHPEETESVLGVTMNQGTYALLFVQHRGKLQDAARQLAAKGYYDDWDEHYLQALFRDREDPRS
jgi:hypothetical protein